VGRETTPRETQLPRSSLASLWSFVTLTAQGLALAPALSRKLRAPICRATLMHSAPAIISEPPQSMDALSIPPHADERPDVTVIVVNYNTAHLFDRMFAALESGRGSLRLQVIVIDNASRDGSVAILRAGYPTTELVQNATNVGFARANNQALKLIRGRYVLLLNTDAFVSSDTLPKTVAFMDAHPKCGVLGVKLVGQDGSLQPSCRYFPTPWNVFLVSTDLKHLFPGTRLVDDMSWDHASVRACDWVPGCYYLVRREVIERVGLFDPRYFLYYEEVDHCRAVRDDGWVVMYYPFTQVMHIGGESAASEAALTKDGRQISTLQIESELLYFRKHHGVTGLWAAVILAMLGDVIIACKGLVRRLDVRRAVAAMRHSWAVLKVLIATRLGARATR
jgi:N-acetylglucosaminyl-diphospho-decaprenol L-rhamnosyltransferase